MKKLLAIAAVTIASTSAFAALELKYRGDYANTPEYQRLTDAEKGSARSEFLGNYARLNASGAVGDATVKTSFDLAGTSAAGAMIGDSFTRYLYVSKPIVDGLTFHMGKIQTFIGGIEGAQDEAGNTYLNTLANGGNAGKWTGAPGTDTPGSYTVGGASVDLAASSPGNNRGVGLTYNYGMGQVDLILTNDSNGSVSQRKHNMGVAWSGNFLDGMIKPLVGYSVGYQDVAVAVSPAVTGDTGKQSITQINVGSDFAINESLGLTAEHFINTGKSDTDAAALKQEDKVTTTYLAASYKINTWKPFLKYEMSTFKNQTASAGVDASSFDRTAGVLGVEYTPANDGLSYHVVYMMANDKYKATTTPTGVGATPSDKVNWQQVVAGFRVTADLLK